MQEHRESLVAFVDRHVASFEAWDILAYLSAHPEARLSLEAMALDLGRRAEDLKAAAAQLEKTGMLLAERDGGWSLSPDPGLRQALEMFSAAINDHKQRLFVLTRLLENLSR